MSFTGRQSMEQFGWTLFVNNEEYAPGRIVNVSVGPSDLVGKKLKIVGMVPRVVAEDFCKRTGWLFEERKCYYAAVLLPEEKPVTAIDAISDPGLRMIEV